MAQLKDFRTDSKAINDGVWIRVGPEFGDIEILTRGFTDRFIDAQEALLTRAAQPYGNNRDNIPNAERRSINASLLEDYLVIDVRNLLDGERTVSVKDFHSMLYEPSYQQLMRACFNSAGRVSTLSEERLRAVLGNLEGSSASS